MSLKRVLSLSHMWYLWGATIIFKFYKLVQKFWPRTHFINCFLMPFLLLHLYYVLFQIWLAWILRSFESWKLCKWSSSLIFERACLTSSDRGSSHHLIIFISDFNLAISFFLSFVFFLKLLHARIHLCPAPLRWVWDIPSCFALSNRLRGTCLFPSAQKLFGALHFRSNGFEFFLGLRHLTNNLVIVHLKIILAKLILKTFINLKIVLISTLQLFMQISLLMYFLIILTIQWIIQMMHVVIQFLFMRLTHLIGPLLLV